MKNLFKKTMITMCSAAMLIGIGAVAANAATVEVGDFTVDRSKPGYSSPYVVSVSAYNGKGGEITLPTTAEINGTVYPITTVGEAFHGNENVTGVTIPEGYTDIGLSAFSNCTSLKKVTIPGSVDMISSNAFLGCSALDTVNFADDTTTSLTINASAFADCDSLTSIELPARLSTTRYNFLYGCDSLTSITVKEGAQSFAAVDNILYNVSDDDAVMVAYPGGKTETEFTIPTEVNGKAVTSTAMHVFRNNAVLKKVTVPAAVTSLGGYTFNGMTAIEEIVLEHETAPSFGSELCTEMKSGSKITVKNEDVAKAFEPTSSTKYYTPENTTVVVAGAEPEVKTVSAAVSIAAESEIKDGKAVYGIYLESAENVSTVLLKVSFDSSQVDEGTIVSANDRFTIVTSTWSKENDKLILNAYMGIMGNTLGFSSDEKTKLAEISVPLKNAVTGHITAKISAVETAGIVIEDEPAKNGTVTINPDSASLFIPSYDVNGDDTVDIIDITEAQRFYQSKSSDDNWSKAKAMDVNGDNKVDIEDYIAIFNNLSDF